MDTQIKSALKNSLIAQLHRVVLDLRDMFFSKVERCSSGPPDQADIAVVKGQECFLSTRRRKFQEVREIIGTLERMDVGMFGVCEKCSGKIDLSRLTAIPTASLCAGCEEEKVM